jgi:hypothetical protein
MGAAALAQPRISFLFPNWYVPTIIIYQGKNPKSIKDDR